MLKVKIIYNDYCEDPSELEEDVNEFLSDNSDLKIVDIKYSTSVVETDPLRLLCSAMVIYKASDRDSDYLD